METSKQRAVRRAKEAAAIAKLVDGIFKDLSKIPSYTGKARFMDKVIKVLHRTNTFASNLNLDSKE
jgi:hypothetical protein